MTLYKNITKKEKNLESKLPNFPHKGQKCMELKNVILIIHVIDLSDLICVKEEINIVKLKS